jgi:methyl-accepting chemotaxis protein
MTIGFRLVCGFLIVSFISLAMGIFNNNSMSGLTRDIANIGSVSLPFASNLGTIATEMNSIKAIIRTLADENLPSNVRERQDDAMVKARTLYADAFTAIGKIEIPERDKEKLEDLKKLIAAWKTSNLEIMDLIKSGNIEKARTLAYGANRELQQNAQDAITDLIATQNKESARIVATANADSHAAILWSNVLIVVGFFVSIGLGLMLTFGITRPLKKAVGMADGLARGDLSLRMSMQSRDEIGMLSRSLDSMADNISRLNENIIRTAEKACSGFLRNSIDDQGFTGEFKNLIGSVNHWVSSMLQVIDIVPSPIMIRDKDRNMRFLNAPGGLGKADVNKLEGLKCENHFITADCTNGRCACEAAFKSRKEERSSTVARPLEGVELDIEYKAIPFGEDAIFEFVTDHSSILKIQRKLTEIASSADQVAEQVSSAAEQLSSQIDQSSRGSHEQAQRIAETATAMEEMNATVLEVAKSASKAAETAEDAKQKAQEGATVVSQVVRGIADVQQNALALKNDMTTLGQQAQGIGQIMNVISDIADQTNLLALNAAIEAARAGEAGRGFAVVADEVRKLAEKTMTATKQVGDAIHGIQTGTQRNIANVEQTVEKIGGATVLATKSGESLGEIVGLVDITTDQVRSIAAASEQQSASSEEINRSIEDISRISMETSDAMRQSAEAVTELANQSHVLSGLIEEMQAGNGSSETRSKALDQGRNPRGHRALALR